MTFSRLYKILFPLTAIWALIVAGCSGPEPPHNPEPVIEMLPVSEITRTEAVISARIQKRGTSNLTYLTFHYGETGKIDRQQPADNSAATIVTLSLSGLRPGTSYSCYVEGGTATASLRSDTVSFTTEPNERPAVSQPVPLSTGPTGLILEFEITDDGGEPVLSAGCDVTNTADGSTRRINLASDELKVGPYRLTIGNLPTLSRFTITPFASNSAGESKGASIDFTTQNSIVLLEPGVLSSVFEGTADLPINRLLISGYMNGDDFRFLRALLGAPTLGNGPLIKSSANEADLTDVYIVEGGDSYDGSRFTENNIVSTGLLADCARLRAVSLPSSATVLARDAVARCNALEALTVPAGIETLLPSADCPSLRAIDVSDGNRNFAGVDGVLFNHDITAIIWFPLGKTGDYTLPSTITAISENAFLGTHITGLVIPESVTSIGRGAFAGSALTEITLPDNLTNVSEGMFQNCSALSCVRLGAGTKYVGNYAFDGTDLKNLYVSATVPPFAATEAFYNRSDDMLQNCTLHVPAASKKIYRNHSKWGLFEHIEGVEAQ